MFGYNQFQAQNNTAISNSFSSSANYNYANFAPEGNSYINAPSTTSVTNNYYGATGFSPAGVGSFLSGASSIALNAENSPALGVAYGPSINNSGSVTFNNGIINGPVGSGGGVTFNNGIINGPVGSGSGNVLFNNGVINEGGIPAIGATGAYPPPYLAAPPALYAPQPYPVPVAAPCAQSDDDSGLLMGLVFSLLLKNENNNNNCNDSSGIVDAGSSCDDDGEVLTGDKVSYVGNNSVINSAGGYTSDVNLTGNGNVINGSAYNNNDNIAGNNNTLNAGKGQTNVNVDGSGNVIYTKEGSHANLNLQGAPTNVVLPGNASDYVESTDDDGNTIFNRQNSKTLVKVNGSVSNVTYSG